ncbi:MAG: hypothetical protein H7327_03700 [Herminiimonas sp.]|nr:hypothetical protein [Herminiimonas sp.]
MDTKLPQATINTAQPGNEKTSPRLPSDRDESPDSQASPPREDMQQAARDIASGQVNTDLRDQPHQNPKNTAPSVTRPTPDQVLPDGTRK